MNKIIALLTAAVIVFGIVIPAFGATASTDSYEITENNKMVIMRVSYATAEFNESFGGVMCAVPEKDTDVYTLYDVVIWSDRISLYKFKGNLDKAAKKYIEENYDWSDLSADGAYEKAWREFRESNCLKTVKVKSPGDPDVGSGRRLDAYKAFFNIIKKKSPSKHVAIKYSGHGGGKTFCLSLNLKDTKALLKYGVKTFGQKFAFIDYGTNCCSGCTDILDFYAPYTDYMIVNQLDFGGWQWDKWDYSKYSKVDTDEVYHEMFKSGEKTADAVKRLAKQHKKCWPYGAEYMRKHKIPQSVTAVKMKEYTQLMEQLKGKDLPFSDLRTSVKKLKDETLMKKYDKAVIYYARNKEQLGTWKSDYGNGLWYVPG